VGIQNGKTKPKLIIAIQVQLQSGKYTMAQKPGASAVVINVPDISQVSVTLLLRHVEHVTYYKFIAKSEK